ncbi:23S rRNA (pseudouridine(1915)-N(3))-methyltransferase RlmH [Psychrobacter sp. FDAARGOS_221]|uniref:23S rRNA (pseudouridine(1915)-N(3))-methyltransferase RlmH n=1 Tax=Psychrobacter sp. FDAARGOS_221 TaxID=1975705 RepID=UPI000BB5761B|nr:23S rRNA (pseudouridine(1915)-N(3))-methyltransferase RlmH [Psychrobacter sp. FDAARGOS_221]PNK61402.1 23S rRNA (pseudouridine(1915)-N(3))-methyltransferase RlmH [Psychrobacter sp. FDAARGOS_221]
MKLRILSVGGKMPKWVNTGFDEYHKRIQPMLSTDMVDLPAAKRAKNPSEANLAQYREQEGKTILATHQSNAREKLWVLDVKGKMLSTEQLADKLSDAMQMGDDVALVIGGADGVSPEVLAAADFKWSLSPLTMPHPLVRVVLMEQLYRAMSINNNHPYHRGN